MQKLFKSVMVATKKQLSATKPKMTVYEFVTPSDPITFLAPNDKVAFVTAVFVGNGKAGCKNLKTHENLGTLLLFCLNPDEVLNESVGGNFSMFVKRNQPKIKAALKSFAYGSASDRETFDAACSAIIDPEKLEDFKSKYEDRNRTSMSRWVAHAWSLADNLK